MKFILQFKSGILLLAILGWSLGNLQALDKMETPDQEEKLLIEVLDEISREYHVYFTYDSDIIKGVMVDYEKREGESVRSILTRVLAEINMDFKIFEERFVILYRKDEAGLRSLEEMISHMETIVLDRKKLFADRHTKPIARLSSDKWSEVNRKRLVLNVTGRVMDANGEPLIGVNVQVKGTNKGTATDIDGRFSLNDIDDQAVLVVSYVGYKNQEVSVEDKNSLTIIMQEDAQMLDEVVVVGYGTQKKINLTGAVTQANSAEFIEERPILSIGQALQGVVPGLTINKSNGIPGGGYSFNIRGQTSLNGGGPLILVDGTEMDPSLVSPEDIESVSVLKDAASAAIYGARGAFGVVLIQTKSGRYDSKPTITYSGTISSTDPTILPEKVDPITQIKVGTLAWENAGRTPGKYWSRDAQSWIDLYEDPNWVPNSGEFIDGIYYPLGNNNMIEEMVESSLTVKNNFSISGGSKNARYYLNAGSAYQDGILVGNKDKYLRKNVLAKMDVDIKDWLSTGATLGLTKGTRNMPYIPNNPGYMYDVSYLRPTFWLTGIAESGVPWGFSPAMIDLGAKNTNINNNTNIQLRLTANPFKDFSINF